MVLKNVTVEWKGLISGIDGNVLTIPFLNFQQRLIPTNEASPDNTLEKDLLNFVNSMIPEEIGRAHV